jgi:hypothetical protein
VSNIVVDCRTLLLLNAFYSLCCSKQVSAGYFLLVGTRLAFEVCIGDRVQIHIGNLPYFVLLLKDYILRRFLIEITARVCDP